MWHDAIQIPNVQFCSRWFLLSMVSYLPDVPFENSSSILSKWLPRVRLHKIGGTSISQDNRYIHIIECHSVLGETTSLVFTNFLVFLDPVNILNITATSWL